MSSSAAPHSPDCPRLKGTGIVFAIRVVHSMFSLRRSRQARRRHAGQMERYGWEREADAALGEPEDRRKNFRPDSSQTLEKPQNREGKGRKRPILGPFRTIPEPIPGRNGKDSEAKAHSVVEPM